MFDFGSLIKSALLLSLCSTSLFSVSNIRITKHNLVAKSGILDASNEELCVFCHTPNTVKGGSGEIPAWNKRITLESFKIYTSAEQLPSDGNLESSNPSLACLSCHDGINAINVIANVPGMTSAPSLSRDTNPARGAEVLQMLGSGPVTMKIRDDTNHPISVEYNMERANLRMINSPLFGWAGANSISSLLRNNRVECGSCHDPHEATNSTFLRVSNANAALCTGCHAK